VALSVEGLRSTAITEVVQGMVSISKN